MDESLFSRDFTRLRNQLVRESDAITAQSTGGNQYWQDESDWLCTFEFLPTDDPEARGSDIIGYLFGYTNLTNTRSFALVGDPDANAYELLFSFSSSRGDSSTGSVTKSARQKTGLEIRVPLHQRRATSRRFRRKVGNEIAFYFAGIESNLPDDSS
jgi:hypothetical protein